MNIIINIMIVYIINVFIVIIVIIISAAPLKRSRAAPFNGLFPRMQCVLRWCRMQTAVACKQGSEVEVGPPGGGGSQSQ